LFPGSFSRPANSAIAKALAGLVSNTAPFANVLADPVLAATPLHIKPVGRLDWNVLAAHIAEELRPTFVEARRCFTEAAWLDEVLRTNPPLKTTAPANLTQEDVGRLISGRWVEEVVRDEIRAWVRVFSVFEGHKGRRRFIAEPRLNDILLDPGVVDLPSAELLCAKALAPGAVQMDFPFWYGQFPLPRSVSPFYGFSWRDPAGKRLRHFVLLTIPTGSRQAPALAQAVSKSIALRVGPPEAQDVYLDNFRFAGSPADSQSAARRFETWCALFGATVGQEKPEHSTDYDFLGVRFSHGDSSVALGQKTRGKLAEATVPETLRGWMSRVSLFVFASRVLGLPLATRFVVFKFLRRRARWPLDAPVLPWNCAAESLERWRLDLLGAPPRTVTTPLLQETVLFTDACPKGWGATWFEGGVVRSTGADFDVAVAAGAFHHEEPIMVLEARALEKGVALVPPSGALKIAVGNSALYFSLLRGWSRNFALNAVVSRILAALRARGAAWDAVWVPSAENLADALSRADRRGRR
jgi:hypothetical protein